MGVGRLKFVLWPHKLNKTCQETRDALAALFTKYEMSYLHAADEVCPQTGTPHVDGYYEYPAPRRAVTERKKFTKAFGPGYGDLDTAYGTSAENVDYSTKEQGTYMQLGTPAVGQGFRTDVESRCAEVTAGKRTVDQIVLEEPRFYHQYGRTLHRVEDLALRSKFRTWMTEGLWLWGPTGVGKSHRAFAGFTPQSHYLWKNNDKGWQDGYSGQETVIINDFRGEIPYNELLQLVDRWPHTLARRGREPVPFLAKTVIITSSLSPQLIYHRRNYEDSLDQLLRRFTVTHMKSRSEV